MNDRVFGFTDAKWKQLVAAWTTVEQAVKSNQKLQSAVSLLKESIFDSDVATRGNEQDLSIEDMTHLMNEIDDDVKTEAQNGSNANNNKDKTDSAKTSQASDLPPKLVETIEAPFKKLTNFQGDLNRKFTVWKEFCQEMQGTGYENRFFKCKSLSFDVSNNNNSNNNNNNKKSVGFDEKYVPLWNDFVLIRFNLLFGDLYQLFIKLGCNKMNINKFYKYFKFYRNQAILLPINCYADETNYTDMLFARNFEEYTKMTQYFDNNNYNVNNANGIKINPILMYIMIYNCVFGMMYNELIDANYGFESTIDSNLNDIDSNDKLIALLSDYMVKQFCQTNIFGTYLESNETKSELNNSIMIKCKELLFNNNLDKFQQFLNNSLKDINITNIKSYKLNENKTAGNDFGFCNLIVSRMSFIIFHDLSLIMSNSNDNSNSMLYPSLSKMYKFLFNFSIYCHSYPFDATYQSFYLSQYFDLRDKAFSSLSDSNDDSVDISVKQFYYYKFQQSLDGTLLHKATSSNMKYYCDILIKDNFDVRKKNVFYEKKHIKSPFDIAKDSKFVAILSLMQV